MEQHGQQHVRWFRLMVDQFDRELQVVQARLRRGPCDETAWRAGCDLERTRQLLTQALAREPRLRWLMAEARTLLPADHRLAYLLEEEAAALQESWFGTLQDLRLRVVRLEETVRQQVALDRDVLAWAERRAALRRIPGPASPDGSASEADDRGGTTDSDEPRRVIIVDEYL